MSLLAFYLILIAVDLVAVAVFNPPLRCLLPFHLSYVA